MYVERDWSTDMTSGRTGIDFWRGAICEAVFELELTLDTEADFSASIRQRPMGPVGFSAIEVNADQTIRRTRQLIARSQRSQFELVLLQTGSAHLEHYGESIYLEKGDSILIDNREPYTFSTTARIRNLSFHLPVSWLHQRLPMPNNIVAKPIRRADAWGSVICGIAHAICDAQNSTLSAQHAEQLAGALALAFADDCSRKPGSNEKMLARAREALREMAHDSELSLQSVCRELGVSLRYLQKLFASCGTTYSNELAAIRLEAARTMLNDPKFSELPINEIAWRAGFSDPSNFYRKFRGRFGAPPGAMRTN